MISSVTAMFFPQYYKCYDSAVTNSSMVKVIIKEIVYLTNDLIIVGEAYDQT